MTTLGSIRRNGKTERSLLPGVRPRLLTEASICARALLIFTAFALAVTRARFHCTCTHDRYARSACMTKSRSAVLSLGAFTMLCCDVAIVGGGFSGTMVAAHLARRADRHVAVALFEPAPIGRGAAFGTKHSELLLNTRAAAMSAYDDDPDHFVRWLGSGYSPVEFVSRRLYGEYLGEIAARAFERPCFTVVPDRVVAIEQTGTGAFVLATSQRTRFEAEHVVLATGNPLPNDGMLPPGLRAHPGYVGDPWLCDYRAIGGDVLLIGSGLTALDALVALEASGHRGAVFVVSRHARFSEVHAENLRAYDVVPVLDGTSARTLLQSFRRCVDDASARGFDWRAAVDAVRPECEALWRRLPIRERRRFDRHLRAHWERHRHRAPQAVAGVRTRYEKAGRLHTYAGRLGRCEDATVSIATLNGEVQLRPDWIVNCTGVGRGQWERDVLLGALLRGGLLEREPLGWGLRNSAENLRLTGSMLRGTRFESTAVGELRVVAQSVASQILETLQAPASLTG